MKAAADPARFARVLAAVSLGAVLLAAVLPPIPQDPQYHAFADTARHWGIPNFWNAVSNLPFLAVGWLGLRANPKAPGRLAESQAQYAVFFAGIFLTGLGSGYYHLTPSNQTLVWDRLPMTLSFMAFMCIVVGEHLSIRAGQKLLWPLVGLGVASVGYWHETELEGRGDLRAYGLVQFLPMLLIPWILLKTPSRFSSARHFWLAILAYGLAKVLEYFDHGIFNILGFAGGHPLKHLAAAAGAWFVYRALLDRKLREGPAPGLNLPPSIGGLLP